MGSGPARVRHPHGRSDQRHYPRARAPQLPGGPWQDRGSAAGAGTDPRETYRRGDRIKAYLLEVRRTPKDVQVVLSRTHPHFVAKLFELEVPEVSEKIVEIKGIVREPGDRTKIAVASRDKAVDPVGACVGIKGSRVQAVVRELRGEKIDIIG